MQLQVQEDGDAISVRGELDLATRDTFTGMIRKLVEDGRRVVILDLTGMRFIDAAGLSALIGIERELREHERVLVLRRPRTHVARILDVTGLTWLLESGAQGPTSLQPDRPST